MKRLANGRSRYHHLYPVLLHEYREAAKVEGASGYVVKKFLVDDLLPAIRQVMDDQDMEAER